MNEIHTREIPEHPVIRRMEMFGQLRAPNDKFQIMNYKLPPLHSTAPVGNGFIRSACRGLKVES